MAYRFVKIGSRGNSWNALEADWKAQTEALGETFDASIQLEEAVLRPLAERNSRKAGVFALHDERGFLMICQINTAGIPGYHEPVMRIRFLTFAPIIDLGDIPLEEYIDILVEGFVGVVNLCVSQGPMKSPRMHFHLPSPSDRQYFAAVGRNIAEGGAFKSIDSKGAWLYISH